MKLLSEFPCFHLTTDSFCFILLFVAMRHDFILKILMIHLSFEIHCIIFTISTIEIHKWRNRFITIRCIWIWIRHKIHNLRYYLKVIKVFQFLSSKSNLNNEKTVKNREKQWHCRGILFQLKWINTHYHKMINKRSQQSYIFTYLLEPFVVPTVVLAFFTPSNRERMHFVSHKMSIFK